MSYRVALTHQSQEKQHKRCKQGGRNGRGRNTCQKMNSESRSNISRKAGEFGSCCSLHKGRMMDVQKLFLCCPFKPGMRNRLSNFFMLVLQNTLSHSRTANPTSKYQNLFLQQNKTSYCDFSGPVCMLTFNIFAKYLALGILLACMSVYP